MYLNDTYEGYAYDKRVTNQEAYRFPKNTCQRLELGYLGCCPKVVLTLLPIKKPYKIKLSEQNKKFNQ